MSHVKGHMRTVHGKAVYIKPHDDKRSKKGKKEDKKQKNLFVATHDQDRGMVKMRDYITGLLQTKEGLEELETKVKQGQFQKAIPEVVQLYGVEQGSHHPLPDAFDHTMEVLRQLPADATDNQRWAALLHDIGKVETQHMHPDRGVVFDGHEHVGAKMARFVLERLQFDRKDKEEILFLINHHGNLRTKLLRGDPEEAKKFTQKRHFDSLMVLHNADVKASGRDPSEVNYARQLLKGWRGSDLKFYNLSELSLMDLEDLEKAVVNKPHSYFTHLVPVKKTDKTGVKRIYWINPDDMGKKPSRKTGKHKLMLVAHHDEGNKKDHLNTIESRHGLEREHVAAFTRGDKVKLLVAPKGQESLEGMEAIYRGSSIKASGSTPVVSISYKNPRTGKWTAMTTNINNLEWVAAGTDETKKVVGHLDEKKTDVTGELIKPKKETPEEEFNAARGELLPIGTYVNKRGREFHIVAKGDKASVTIIPQEGPDGKMPAPKRVTLDTEAVKGYLKSGKLNVKPPHEPTSKVGSLKNSYAMERGLAHFKGYIVFDEKGEANWADTPEAKTFMDGVVAEQLASIRAQIYSAAEKYKHVDPTEVSVGDIYEGLMKGLAGYNPYKGNLKGGFKARASLFANGLASSKAEAINDRRKATESIDNLATDEDAGIDALTSKTAATHDEDEGQFPIGSFVMAQDTMILKAGLADEADLVDWHFDNPEISAVVQDWLGLGKFEATLTTEEAAAKLEGHVMGASGVPVKAVTIKNDILPEYREKVIETFKEEAKNFPEFEHSVKQNFRLRKKIRDRKSVGETELTDVEKRVEKEIKETYDGGKKSKAVIAAKLIHHGFPVAEVPKLIRATEKILEGFMAPAEYSKEIGAEHADKFDAFFTDLFNVKSMKELPRRLRVGEVMRSQEAAAKKFAVDKSTEAAKVLDE